MDEDIIDMYGEVREKAAKLLQEYRAAHARTQEEVADTLYPYGISLSVYRRAEKGKPNVSLEKIIQILDALHIELEDVPIPMNVRIFRNSDEALEQHIRDNIEWFFYSKNTTPYAEMHYRRLLFLFVLYLPLIPPLVLQDVIYRIGGNIFGNELYVLDQINRAINSVSSESPAKKFADGIANRILLYDPSDTIECFEQKKDYAAEDIEDLHNGSFSKEYRGYMQCIRERFDTERWLKDVNKEVKNEAP